MRIPRLLAPTTELLLTVVLVACVPKPRVQSRPMALPVGEVRVGVVSPGTPALAARVEGALLADVPEVKVVAHAHQSLLASEKALQISGHFDNDAIAAIGAQLGATVLVVVEQLAAEEAFLTQRSRYAVRLSGIDIESGLVLGSAEVDGTKEQFQLWGECTFDCLQDLVLRRAVAALFGPADGVSRP